MAQGFSPQWVRGTTSRQAHADLPPGTVEEEHGREGFSGPASHLYRLRPPTEWKRIDGPLRHHALDTGRIQADAGAGDGPVMLFENTEVRVGYWKLSDTPDWFYADADGDQLYFVHHGSGTLETEYGPLGYRDGHYLLVPRGTIHRFVIDTATELLTVEATGGSMWLPDRGLLGPHALFDPAIIDVPEPQPRDEPGEFLIRISREGAWTTVMYPHHPFTVVGWKGDVAPLRVHIDDIRPVTSARYHLPPSAHTSFMGRDFVVVTMVPRPLEEDPAVLRVPFYHRNIDYDEIVFYSRGQFVSREGIGEGMFTFHPHGLFHGPQPEAVERSNQAGPGGHAHDVAINIDTRRPLHLTPAGLGLSVEGYDMSWQPKTATSNAQPA